MDARVKAAAAGLASYGEKAACGVANATTTQSTLMDDIGRVVALAETIEYSLGRVSARLFDGQPLNGEGAIAGSGSIAEADINRARQSLLRARDMLEALEARLG